MASETLEPIAIVGVGCYFPGAKDIEAFWSLLSEGREAIAEMTRGRWDQSGDKAFFGGLVEDIYGFDASFFNLSEVEAKSIDPQHRIYYQAVWQALENAFMPKEALNDKLVGVFTGISTNDYSLNLNKHDNLTPYSASGNAGSIASNRLSYLMNWRGPSISIDTACSSSLVAIHLACQSIRNGESEIAIAGGTNALLRSEITEVFDQAGMMAKDGKCKTFDAAADGYVRGEGAGAVVLQKLSQAQEQGKRILGVVKGSAVNQDGATNGLTAPNVQSQESVIQKACENAGVTPGDLEYVELHGTGTLLGDPVEAAALGKTLKEGRKDGDVCAVGSVKTNIGHL